MSGTFSVSTTNSYIVGSVYWEERNVNTSANQSDVYVEMRLWRSNSGYTTYGTGNFYVTVNGTQLSHTGESYTLSYNSNTLVLSGTVTVPHNSDGTKTVSISWSGNGDSGFTINNGSGSATLTSIARQSTISSGVYWTAGTQNLGVSLSVSSSSYHHTLTLEVQNPSGTWTIVGTWTNVGSSTTLTFTQSQITTMYNYIQQRSSCPATLYCDTYDSSGNHVGSQTNSSGTCYAINATTPTLGNFNIGTKPTISLNPPNNSFTHKLDWVWGSFKPTLANGVTGTSYIWDQTAIDSGTNDTYANGMYKQIPNNNTGFGSLTVTTYYNGVQVQQPVSTGNVYGYVIYSNPIFNSGSVTYKDTNTTTVGITGNNQNIVQNQSQLSVTIPVANRATAQNYATMSSYSITVNGVTKTATWSSTADVVVAFGTIGANSNVTCTATAIDSRGNSTPQSVTITVTPYSPPVAVVTATRQNNFDSNTTIALNGSYSTITPTGSGTGNKLGTVQYKYKDTTLSTWSSWYPFTIASNNPPNYTATNATVSLDNTKSWNIEVTVSDSLMTTTVDKIVGTGQPVVFIDSGMKKVGINKLPSSSGSTFQVSGSIDVSGDVHTNWLYGNTGVDLTLSPASGQKTQVNSDLNVVGYVKQSGNELLPAGILFPYGGGTIPSGYLICNGQAVSRTTYSRLFSAIGTSYGAGDGSTTFNVPNLCGRVPVGLWSGDTDWDTLGKTGGEKNHKLTTSEMPIHSHQTTANGGYYFFGGSAGNPAGGSGYGTQSSTLRTDNQGGDGVHNNMQPYTIVNYIIKT